MTSELDHWKNNSSLSRKTKREISQIEAIADVLKAAFEEENRTYRHANEKVSNTLNRAEAKKNRKRAGLSDTKETEFRHLTQGYLDEVVDILADQDKSLLRELERATGGKIDSGLLSSPNRKLLDW